MEPLTEPLFKDGVPATPQQSDQPEALPAESFPMADLPVQTEAEPVDAQEPAFRIGDLPVQESQAELEAIRAESFPMADLPVQAEEITDDASEKPPDMLYTPFPDFPQMDEDQKREFLDADNRLGMMDLPQQTENGAGETASREYVRDSILDVQPPSVDVDAALSNPMDDPEKFEEEQKAAEAKEKAERDREEGEDEEKEESQSTSHAQIGIIGPTQPDAIGGTMVKEKKGAFDFSMFDIKQSKDKPEGELNIKDKAEDEIPPELEMALKQGEGNVMVTGMKGDAKNPAQASAMGVKAKGSRNPLVSVKNDEDEGFLKKPESNVDEVENAATRTTKRNRPKSIWSSRECSYEIPCDFQCNVPVWSGGFGLLATIPVGCDE